MKKYLFIYEGFTYYFLNKIDYFRKKLMKYYLKSLLENFFCFSKKLK